MSQLWFGEAVRPYTVVRLVQEEALAVFSEGEKLKVSARAKGRGFAGVVKRHHFRGGPATHGQSDRERAPGSIGGTTTPGRVYRGKRMAGRLGGQKVTLKTEVLSIDREKKELRLLGGIPGAFGAEVILRKLKQDGKA